MTAWGRLSAAVLLGALLSPSVLAQEGAMLTTAQLSALISGNTTHSEDLGSGNKWTKVTSGKAF